MKYHKHWVFTKENAENRSHPISQKHKNTESQIRHDLETGKLRRWLKKNNLPLVDSSYARYEREVLNKVK